MFLFQNNLNKIKFFKKTFLLVNTSMELIPRMPFIWFYNANVKFAKKFERIICIIYINIELLVITNQVKSINKKKFAKVILNKNFKIFIMDIATL